MLKGVLVAALFLSSMVFAGDEFVEGFVEVAPLHSFFTRIHWGDPKKPPIIVFNGLTHDVEHWRETERNLLKSGSTIVMFDAFFQGRTLHRYLLESGAVFKMGTHPVLEPLLGEKLVWLNQEPIIPRLPITQQSYLLAHILDKLNIKKPAILLGLSYGGGFALQFASDYPERVKSLVLLAPYVAPLPTQDALIKDNIEKYKQMYPYQPFQDHELYDYNLRQLVLMTYPLAEPQILKWGPFQVQAAAEMVRGIRHIKAEELVKKIPQESVHLLIAENDAYIPQSMLRDFWRMLNKKQRGSLTLVKGVEHKINEVAGDFVGAMTSAIALGHQGIRGGREFFADHKKQRLIDSQSKEVVDLSGVNKCADVLSPLEKGD